MDSFLKKMISCVLMVCFIFSFSTVVLAKEYTLDKLGVSLEMPNGWYVFDKNSKIGDYPLSEEEFNACMSTFDMSSAVVLYAVSPSYDAEILITYNTNTQKINYNSIPNEMLEELMAMFKNEFSDMGMPVTSSSIYEGTNTKFIKALYSRPGQDIYTIQYSTSTTKDSINITLNSYYDNITSEDEKIAKAVANSLTGLTDDLFAVIDINSSTEPIFDLEEMPYKFIVGGLSGAILSGIILLFKGFKKDKTNTDNSKENIAKTNIQEETKNTVTNNFCRVCGEKLSDNSLFCHKCGTRVLSSEETENDLP